jgi:hypothetical protein
MNFDLADPRITAALERAGMLPTPPPVSARLNAACAAVCDPDEELLEVSQATWATETAGEDVLIVLMRKLVVLVSLRKGGLFRTAEPQARVIPLSDYRYVAEDDEMLNHSVFFLAPDEEDHFLLSWTAAGERRRMFRAIFAAHAGRYEQWGLQLDPDDYGIDFDRYYAQLATEATGGESGLYDWAEERFGEFDIGNALGFAVDWRGCVLADETGREPSWRVGRLAFPYPWIEAGPEAQRLFVRLGEELFDAGLLAPPYNERTFEIDDEPIGSHDAGPARLLALMTLATSAKATDHGRAPEWIEGASAGIGSVPPSVFSQSMREMWSEIAELPAVDESPPAEIPIQDDVDVRAISTRDGDRVVYSQDGLTIADDALIKEFFVADGELGAEGLPDGEAVLMVCLLGVKAFEGLSPEAPAGWRKLILYAVSDLTYDLWNKYKLGDPAAKLAHWVIAGIEANGWGPDGRSTPLGQHHSFAMGVAVDSGVGAIVLDPETGAAKAPTGDEARSAAAVGHF